jgi:nucleoid-associated protein YgaU
VPLAGGLQRAAARLVAAVALAGALVASRGAPGLPEAKPLAPIEAAKVDVLAAVGDKVAPGPAPDVVPEPAPAPVTPPRPVYVVQRYDSLWDIAERHLGNGLRWGEIFELNRNVVQDDGSRLENPDRIYPGWRLVLPADAVLATPSAPDG